MDNIGHKTPSWRSKGTTLVSYNPTRGSVRGFDGQYYNRNRRRYKASEKCKLHGEKQSPVHGTVIKTLVKNLNLDYVKPQRAGIIMYTKVNDAVYFGFGLDSRTHDLTDCAGGVVYKSDGDCIRGALREFDEETLSIFNPISVESLSECPVIYDSRNLIIFMHINMHPETISSAFNEKYKKFMTAAPCPGEGKKNCFREPEVCGITWLTWEEFQYSIRTKGILYSRLQRFLSRADNFAYLL